MPEPFSVFLQSGRKWTEEIHGMGLRKKHTDNILLAFQQTGALIVSDLITIIKNGSRSGRLYMYRGHKYIASAPGEPPANRNGKLVASFVYEKTVRALKIASNAFSDEGAPYPFFLEVGTSKMQPRPYFVKTVEGRAEDLRNKLYSIARE